MSAFRRRTLFAAPLILSIATSCSKKDERTSNPPEPSRNPPDPGLGRRWDVRRVDAGKCEAEMSFECPPDTKCNPPAPQAVECPPGTSGKTVITVVELRDQTCGILPKDCVDASCVKIKAPCPLPAGQKLPDKLVEVWVAEKNKTGEGCHAEEPVDCPPGKDCNPPSPMKIACPPGVTVYATVKVGRLPDKTCAILPEGCNAPGCATTKTPCPSN